MTENIYEEFEPEGYQVFLNDMKWRNSPIRNMKKNAYNNLPKQFIYDIPETIIAQANKKNNVFEDVIESYIYNSLTKKFGFELGHVQIWLMF